MVKPPARPQLFDRLLGAPEVFSLEHRVLNAAALTAFVACLGAPPVYLFADEKARPLLYGALAMGVVSAVLYYLSRVRRWFRAPAIVAVLGTLIGAVFFYFSAGGSQGSALTIFTVTLVVSTVLFRGVERTLLVGLPLAMPGVLLGIEMLRPSLVTQVTQDPLTRVFFVGLTYGGALVALGALALVVVRAYRDATEKLRAEQVRSQELLDNVLPPSVSERLLATPGAIADGFDEVTVLFADLVGFTARSAQMEPRAVVAMLNDVFSRFDAICARSGLEKVKTIGDAYMAVAGIPIPRADHAAAAATMALELLDAVPEGLTLRIGLHSGPAVAGVIGSAKFIYDLWGDTVNTASRMESQGEPGRIQVTRETRDRLGDAFVCIRRGVIAIKGKGDLETFFLESIAKK